MADDGLLLNFAIGDTNIIKPETRLKGGTWRDRLSAKKIAQHRTRNPRKPGEERPSSNKGPQNPNRIQNPTPQNVEEVPEQEPTEDAKPTNAPLIDGLDTFTNLGLSPSLAAHLLTKLELKAPTGIQKASMSQLLKEDSDAFIQAETGSGKTLAYLLPLVQRIMTISNPKNMSTDSRGEPIVHRDSGLFAIVLAPTRELCKQISVVLESLLRCAHWIVAGTVIGGEKKKSEKARLRKGLNILVATPGRLADHLENTQALDVSNVRWLVLDEGDRLMELGFEKELQGIIQKLDARQRPSRIPGIPTKRTTILCSATLKMNVQKLGEISLKDAVHIKADPADEDGESKRKDDDGFRVPAQLKQSYALVAAKLRLVTLTAYLKRTFMRKGSVMKAIVFVSCADSVDFHFEVFSRKKQYRDESEEEKEDNEDDDEDNVKTKSEASPHGTIAPAVAFSNPSNPVKLHKLHGSLPQHVRTATLNAFSREREPSVLVCTDVASRGLDLPNVDLVIEYDPAFSADDHTHRIGRTARLGRDGRALIFLMPGCEENYVEVLKRGYRDGGKALTRTTAEDILKRGFGGNITSETKNWEEKATDWQMDLERWAVDNPEYLEMARRAYQSHIRAYATHIASERSMFNIKELHLGHLAKSFALRDRPSKINVPGLRPGDKEAKKDYKAERKTVGKKRKAGGRDDNDFPSSNDATSAAQKMRAKLKEHMAGASEFNLA
ncbi:P-loop containing nucleoside triphosphate hydrolase protein [Aspergillus pseudotamarii]|uniref:ATP-dependent RNA helicase n=1 Tax=Aspergillus pseudotamarii TaxID=132259 RepID=A0A5N6SDF4_ASPPS|nr:P-loop containing nucleoside triphosphate hydrolase protein [Aspergillus pseudotamarii]KAE8132645.1 P-loop containing nucleoside triphosphate hydrolase protein [Aspergillus pseudotamarii]